MFINYYNIFVVIDFTSIIMNLDFLVVNRFFQIFGDFSKNIDSQPFKGSGNMSQYFKLYKIVDYIWIKSPIFLFSGFY